MKPTVLVIDDEKTFRIVAEEALSAEGFTVTSASNGQAGLAAWQREPCDSGDPRSPPPRHRRHRDPGDDDPGVAREEHRHADRRGHRLRRRHQRGAGAQAGGLRLPVKAAPAPRVPGHRAQGDRGPAAARAGAPADRSRAGGDGRPGGRLVGGDEEGDRHGRQGRPGARHDRADPGRVGDRQGADRRSDRAPHESAARTVRSWRSTAPRCRRACSRASCSATSAAPSPTPRRRSGASSRRPTAGPCCSTRSARCRWPPRPSC